MVDYQGVVVEFLYDLKKGNSRPIYETNLSMKFTDDEHKLFSSGSDVVLISENPEQSLRGYWEKRRDVAKGYLIEDSNVPVRIVTYAQVDRSGIPRITRASLSETGQLIQGESIGWSEQTKEVMRRY